MSANIAHEPFNHFSSVWLFILREEKAKMINETNNNYDNDLSLSFLSSF